MKILLTGKSGQVGYELERSLQGLGEILTVDHHQMDLSDLKRVREVIRSIRPNLIVNPAAYTAVDMAENDVDLAMRINCDAPRVMAEEIKSIGGAMIHYSTDYVFDGSKDSSYTEEDDTCPVNSYGRSKLAGEQAITETGIPHLILRTSWIYGNRGKNFLQTILRLARERDELRIVGDQHGAPTWCRTIADSTAHLLVQAQCSRDPIEWFQSCSGIYHMTAQGQTTWHDFTKAILENLKMDKKINLYQISTKEYPLPAVRPLNSVMSSNKFMEKFCALPQWRQSLNLCQFQ